ncbi:MAG: restriction endonuclease [Bacteroidetes bacterium]|nr:restriction endonuclease [Bacteroidota bacterium]
MNEVGNDIEPFLKSALNSVGFEAQSPKGNSGKSKSTGYPDIEFKDLDGKTNYIECKTYNIENIHTTQRSFYLSPSEDFKITKDAIHFIVSFEIYVSGRIKMNNIYKAKSWKILDAFYLLCDVKYEFNSDNRRMYDRKLILAEGSI